MNYWVGRREFIGRGWSQMSELILAFLCGALVVVALILIVSPYIDCHRYKKIDERKRHRR